MTNYECVVNVCVCAFVIQKVSFLDIKLSGKSTKFSGKSLHVKLFICKGNKTIICMSEDAAICKHA